MKFAHTEQHIFIEANICGAPADDTDEHFKFTSLLLPFLIFATLSKKVNRLRVCWFDTKKN